MFLCLDSDTAGSEACTRLAQSIPGEIAVIRLVPARKDWNDVLRQQGDIPSRKFIAETITLRELPTAQPVPMLRMADVELTSVDWLWFPYIPFGKLTIIQGNPGEGKTYFAMRLAAACTNRKPLPGMETLEPFNIIYQTAEDGLGDTVKPRLMEAEADLERVLVIDDRDTPLTLADERIARAIRENNARLVIIDPVQAFLGADVDMNRANEVRPDIPQSGRHCTGYRVRYRADRTPEQSRRNAKHLPGIGVYRHYGGSPQSAVYRQAEGQPHNEGAYP